MFENRRMPNGTSEPSLGLCGVGGRVCEGSLYPIKSDSESAGDACQALVYGGNGPFLD